MRRKECAKLDEVGAAYLKEFQTVAKHENQYLERQNAAYPYANPVQPLVPFVLNITVDNIAFVALSFSCFQ
jgi:hypothetical protein